MGNYPRILPSCRTRSVTHDCSPEAELPEDLTFLQNTFCDATLRSPLLADGQNWKHGDAVPSQLVNGATGHARQAGVRMDLNGAGGHVTIFDEMLVHQML